MALPAQFTISDAERIGHAVAYIERSYKGATGYKKTPVHQGEGFFARITDGTNGKYSWESLRTGSNDDMTAEAEWPSGDMLDSTGYAVEAIWHSEYVLDNSVVRMYPAMEEEFYFFEYRPSGALARATSQIDAGNGGHPGSGTARLYHFDGTNTAQREEITVYNSTSVEIDIDKYLQLKYINGLWYVDVEDCQ